MKGAYQTTTKAGFIKVMQRYVEDPNRSMLARLFLALSPLFVLYVISPLDIVPEAFLGPLGLADDGAILIALFLIIRFALSFYSNKKYVPKLESKNPSG